MNKIGVRVRDSESTALERMERKERAFVRAIAAYGEACTAESIDAGIDSDYDAVQCGSGQTVVAAVLYAKSEIMTFLRKKSGMRLSDAEAKKIVREAIEHFVQNALHASEASDSALASMVESSDSSDERRRSLADVIRREESGDGIDNHRHWAAGPG
jgi:hypothetical protein